MTHVYSEDPEEEARLLAIRDAPCRITAMAQCRLARWQAPIASVEQLWLEERFLTGVARDQTIPQLSPQEWHALTRAILSLAPSRSLREPARPSLGGADEGDADGTEPLLITEEGPT